MKPSKKAPREAAEAAAEPSATDALYMSASEAASALNVSVATLYTYVSRKGLRVDKQFGARGSRYLRADIERLRTGEADQSSEPASNLVTGSALTLVSESGSYYRGQSAVVLARTASLEDVARLLWGCGDTDPFAEPIPDPPAHWQALCAATLSYNPLDRFAMLLPAIEAANPRAHDLGQTAFQRSGAHILRTATGVFLGGDQPASGPVHSYIAATTHCGPALESALRQVLVLAADQALEPATYAVRATANTGATPYRCVLAGLAAISGKRLPSVRTTAFARFMNEVETAADPTEPVRVRFRESEDLPGFGYSPFAVPDPRAAALHAELRNILADDPQFQHFDRAMTLASELVGRGPDFAFLAAFVTRRIGVDPHGNLIRLSRLVGWIAHALEQQQSHPLRRFRVNYTGELPL